MKSFFTSKIPSFSLAKTFIKITALLSARLAFQTYKDFKELDQEMKEMLFSSQTTQDLDSPLMPSDILTTFQRATGNISDIKDLKNYKIGFMRKHCVPLTANFVNHGSIVLIDEQNKTYWQLGRQSDYFLKPQIRAERGLSLKANLSELLWTRINNESDYDFFEGAQQEILMTTSTISGAEIKKAVNYTNQKLCDDRLYIPHWSNCYSTSILLLLEMLNRAQQIDHGNTHSSLKQLLLNVSKDNFGLGVANNQQVLDELRMVNIKRFSNAQ